MPIPIPYSADGGVYMLSIHSQVSQAEGRLVGELRRRALLTRQRRRASRQLALVFAMTIGAILAIMIVGLLLA